MCSTGTFHFPVECYLIVVELFLRFNLRWAKEINFSKPASKGPSTHRETSLQPQMYSTCRCTSLLRQSQISIHCLLSSNPPLATDPGIKCLFGRISFHLVVGCAAIRGLWSCANMQQAWPLSEGFISSFFFFFFPCRCLSHSLTSQISQHVYTQSGAEWDYQR